MTLFRSRYRIETTRLKHHAYTHGWYFVTICTGHRLQWFGEIRQGKMILSEAGKIVEQCWLDIPRHFPHTSLDAFVVMPDHVHGIIVMNDAINNVAPSVETQNFAALRNHDSHNRFGPQSKNLASVIRGFKIGVTKYARVNNLPFHWQPRYHDRIIRSSGGLNAIRKYIHANPEHWTKETIPWHEDAYAWGM